MDIDAAGIRLRQEESGIILHDESGAQAEEITFTSATHFKLAPGESHEITGNVTIPLAKSNFLSFGVLVRDNGQVSADDNPQNLDPSKTNATIRFVTQYVLRIDIETGEKDLSEMSQITFEGGAIRNVQGMPVAVAYLVNPTNFAFECQVNGQIESSTSSSPTPFRMGLPSRVNLIGDDRYLVRIMPQSRVAIQAEVEELLFPGNQGLHLSVSNGRRALAEQNFSINIHSGDFPALETKLAYLGTDLSIEPAQIQMGQIASADRTAILKFTNSATEESKVDVEVRDLQGNPIDKVRLSSKSFSVRAGRSNNVRATLLTDKDLNQPIYGKILVRKTDTNGNVTTESLPLALLFGAPPKPQIELAELESVEVAGVTSFRVRVTNRGVGYVPVHAELSVADSQGRVMRLSDGYGKWLVAGETRELKFAPEVRLPAGEYQLSLRLKTTDEQPEETRTLIINLNPAEEEKQETARAAQRDGEIR